MLAIGAIAILFVLQAVFCERGFQARLFAKKPHFQACFRAIKSARDRLTVSDPV
jgi:hypothetical protein